MEERTSLIDNKTVCILVTNEDINGDDILAMSDFFSGYVKQLTNAIKETSTVVAVPSIPIGDIGIIGEVVQRAEIISRGTTQLIPDFESLPKEVRQKLKEGIYKVGESKQVDGNLRAVIVDETGTRVKDVTLKEVETQTGTLEASRSIANQLQMRQIYNKLDAIQEMQNFQIARSRDQDIKVPFLDARFHILKAQVEICSKDERKKHLEIASDKLLSSVNSVYTELSTSAERLEKLTRFPIFQRKNQIREYMGFMSEDLQIATKLVGLRLQLLDYLGDLDGAKIELNRYSQVMEDFFSKPIGRSTYSAAELMHLNYPYTKDNLNCWHQLSIDVKPKLVALKSNYQNHIYLVSVEDDNGNVE